MYFWPTAPSKENTIWLLVILWTDNSWATNNWAEPWIGRSQDSRPRWPIAKENRRSKPTKQRAVSFSVLFTSHDRYRVSFPNNKDQKHTIRSWPAPAQPTTRRTQRWQNMKTKSSSYSADHDPHCCLLPPMKNEDASTEEHAFLQKLALKVWTGLTAMNPQMPST